MNKNFGFALLSAIVLLPQLQGCFPLVAAGATGGVLATVDRRTLGTQTEDEAIEWKARSRINQRYGDEVHGNYTSFNRKVLISGEALNDEIRADAGRLVSGVPQVQEVHNELAVAPFSSFAARSNDAFITTKVKGRLVDNKNMNAVHVKVVTEASIVYLMGIVSQREADIAIQVTRTTSGVRKVVSLLEILPDQAIKELDIRIPPARSDSVRSEPVQP
ncbi:MAG TPA: BON domain-containing protein [Accumulibacter sp.]|nr:BON domain-containing protein [Accumulibacter sp.]HMW16267.1 BON domain-containing protein [Accumulibacter sp.]HMX23122.1 BON domain-containing protein [Accumulibacter sp.]HMY07026.1 BON domain-containing protein [Accumulibacter sp.]HNC16778.1 BON domain-containing protein [Accumulibacter sp.]